MCHPITGDEVNRPFTSCCEPHFESGAKCKVYIMKITFHSYINKTNFHNKSFAVSLALIMRFTATRKWPIVLERTNPEDSDTQLATLFMTNRLNKFVRNPGIC